MSKRKPKSIQEVLNWIARGDGQGTGPSYKPFYHVRDVPSRGRSSMVEGLITDRTHHYLSDLEFAFHILAEYEGVQDIREQFALLPWGLTQAIAKTLGIKHPTYPGTNIPVVMTSDLVLTVSTPSYQGLEVISVKDAISVGLKKPDEDNYEVKEDMPTDKTIKRNLEKLLIEKTFWTIKKARWSLKTELDLPLNKVKNLIMLRNCLVGNERNHLNKYLPFFPGLFKQAWTPSLSLNTILDETGRLLKLDRNDCFTLFGRSVWLHLLDIDLDTEEICHQLPIRFTEYTAGEDWEDVAN